MKLFNKNNLQELNWTDAYAKAYLEPLIMNGVENYITNIIPKSIQMLDFWL